MVVVTARAAVLLLCTAFNLSVDSTDAFAGVPLAVSGPAARHPVLPSRGGYRAGVSTARRSNVGAVCRTRVGMMSSEGADASAVPPAAGQPAPYVKKRGIFGGYDFALKEHPVITKALTSGVVSAIGYVAAQYIGRKAIVGPMINVQTFAMYVLAGTLYVPVVLHYWFAFLESLRTNAMVTSITKNNKWADALVQLAFDQTFGAAIINCGFMAIVVVLKTAVGGHSMAPAALYAAVSGKISSEFWNMMKANWKLWPAANFINFALIPLRYRVLMTNLVAIAWHIIIAKLTIRGL